MQDLFSSAHSNTIDDFLWSVAIFRAQGATLAIKNANEHNLKTYYPFRRNRLGDFIPLWRNYLFIEFRRTLTIQVCRSTINFIKLLSINDEPILVRKNVIDENMRLLQLGKFDDLIFRRKFYGKGSIVTIIHGDFADRKVELLVDITPDMSGSKKVNVSIGGWKASIEISKLSLAMVARL